MSRKRRREMKELAKELTTEKAEKGWKLYSIGYGGILLLKMEIEDWETMTKKVALHYINEELEEKGKKPVNNLNKVFYCRIC